MVRLISNKTLGFLYTYAGWFVALAWISLLLALTMWVLVGATSGISVFYHPLHRNAPFHLSYLAIAKAAFYAAIIVALGSLGALLLRKRLLASASVIFALVIFPVGATIKLLLVQPGPQEFQRYIGSERLVIPWTFNPQGSERPNEAALTVWLCLENRRGTYDPECRNARQLTARSRQEGFKASFDMDFFHKHVLEMQAIDPRNSHQGFAYTSPPDKQGKSSVQHYYILRDGDGQPVRLTKCYEFGTCAHTALIDRYRLAYTMKDEAAAADWLAMDRTLADLIASWRALVSD